MAAVVKTHDPIDAEFHYSFMFPFEERFDYRERLEWMRLNWTLGFWFVVVYLSLVFGLQRAMRSRAPFQLRRPLAIWNVCLAIFSLLGTARMLPEFLHALRNHGLQYTVCSSSFAEHDRVSGFWFWLIAVSKSIEMGDTVFMVLRKQPLTFLHVFHHLSVVPGTWYFCGHRLPMLRWMTLLNYSIHSVMYSYYAFKALRFNVPRWVSMIITIYQVIQHFLGVIFSWWALEILSNGGRCNLSTGLAKKLLFSYSVFSWLFVSFFYNTYIKKRRSKSQKLE